VRVPERGDRIEPLLVGHDEQDVGPSHNVILSKAKNLGSILDPCPKRNDQRCFAPLNMTAVSTG
jgi:hypothetical protein